MAGTIFLDFGEDIAGSSTDGGQADKIVVQSFSMGGSNPTSSTRADGEGGTVGRVSLNDMSISKEVDKATPTIFSYMCQGKNLETVTLFVYKASASGEDVEFLKYTMTKVIISSHNISGSDGVASESLSLNYGTIVIQVTPTTSDNNEGGTAVPKGWDQTASTVKDD